jgi:hypothetical protein
LQITLSRKAEAERLEEEGEEGMVHSLLSGLPHISDDEAHNDSPGESIQAILKVDGTIDDVAYQPLDDQAVGPEPTFHSTESCGDDSLEVSEESRILAREDVMSPNVPDSLSDSSLDPESLIFETDPVSVPPCRLEEVNEKPALSSSPPPSPLMCPRRPKIPLVSLLIHADELYNTYHPSHPSIDVASILGPQSVVFTWSEVTSDMPADDEAEGMVENLELIVKPYVEPLVEKESGWKSEKEPKKNRRRPRKAFKFNGVVVHRKTAVVGAMLVLGVAMAMYGIRSRPSGVSIGEYMRARGWRLLGRLVGMAGVGENVNSYA